eukprot:CAMPEP_0176474396 /NCGR_PEP_ID=MMETSP0127-20121128/42959_1 /TAXON_ID=938130 /ORGANISM="Platyophrya macrostoma, Strain WH" /LENGTH=78 /DNA_ID=CAMNT_0017869739 /DNA_START=166 /DNA_END=402 /DNA_ORIENTATION=+
MTSWDKTWGTPVLIEGIKCDHGRHVVDGLRVLPSGEILLPRDARPDPGLFHIHLIVPQLHHAVAENLRRCHGKIRQVH